MRYAWLVFLVAACGGSVGPSEQTCDQGSSYDVTFTTIDGDCPALSPESLSFPIVLVEGCNVVREDACSETVTCKGSGPDGGLYASAEMTLTMTVKSGHAVGSSSFAMTFQDGTTCHGAYQLSGSLKGR